MTKEEAAKRLKDLVDHVDAEYQAIYRTLGEQNFERGTVTVVVLEDGLAVDLERLADAIALAGAGLREVINARHRGALRKKVSKALGYYR